MNREPDLALAGFARALALEPMNIDALLNRASTLHHKAKFITGDPEQKARELQLAYDDLEAVLQRQPNNVDALLTRGFLFETLGKQDEATRSFRGALAVATDALRKKIAEDQLRRLGEKP